MSFGWSAGDIVSAISVIVKVSNGLKDVGGAASSYRDSVDFLNSVQITLNGISTVLGNNAHLAWEDALIAQATRLKKAIDSFVAKANKFEKSLGQDSERSKIKQVPRKVHWTLFADEVGKLKMDIERTMGVMNDLVLLQSLDSILEASKTNKLSFDKLKDLSSGINQILPSVSESISALDEHFSRGFQLLENGKETMEASLILEIQDLKSCMADLAALKAFADGADDRQQKTRSRWQQDLERAAKSVHNATKAHLEIQMQSLRHDIRNIVEEELVQKQAAQPFRNNIAITAATNILGSGLASAAGAIIALSTQAKYSEVETSAKGAQLAGSFLCCKCWREFSSARFWELHQREHGKGPLQCEHCLKTFSFRADLSQHEILHLPAGSMPYQCKGCRKYFSRKDKWQRHIAKRKLGCEADPGGSTSWEDVTSSSTEDGISRPESQRQQASLFKARRWSTEFRESSNGVSEERAQETNIDNNRWEIIWDQRVGGSRRLSACLAPEDEYMELEDMGLTKVFSEKSKLKVRSP